MKKGYLIQAVAIPVWWVGMTISDRVYSYFAYPGIGRTAVFSFLLPDLVVISALSIVAWLRPNKILQGCILGAFAYGTLWCLSASLMSRGGFLGGIVMVLGTLFNVLLLLEQGVFKMSRTGKTARNVTRTLLQSLVIWTTTLVVFPLGIVHASGDWPPQITLISAAVGGLAFVLFSAVGIWSGIVMATSGVGTPLPLDSPQCLVISGPYAYVRNPMAIAGLGQGVSVAILLNSVEVTVYVALGLLVWNYFVRPEEERYMEGMFGDSFIQYRSSVRCWFPRSRRFQLEPGEAHRDTAHRRP